MEEEEGRENVEGLLNNLTIETAGMEEDSEEGLEAALGMEVARDGKEEGEGEEWGDGAPRALGALEFLTQYTEQSGTTLVDARNGFNELSRLAMMGTVWYRWPVGARFVFNCYSNWLLTL